MEVMAGKGEWMVEHFLGVMIVVFKMVAVQNAKFSTQNSLFIKMSLSEHGLI